jgi:hypothetical protein
MSKNQRGQHYEDKLKLIPRQAMERQNDAVIDFTYDVHPFQFASDTGFTSKLVTAKVSGETSPRERLPLWMFSKNTVLISFSGKFGETNIGSRLTVKSVVGLPCCITI